MNSVVQQIMEVFQIADANKLGYRAMDGAQNSLVTFCGIYFTL